MIGLNVAIFIFITKTTVSPEMFGFHIILHFLNSMAQCIFHINKVYIDGPCSSKTLAGVLLARFEIASHVTHFY